MNGKHVKLLDDPEVNRWYKNLARGAHSTADVYLRKLGWFCERNQVTPASLVNLPERSLFGLLLDNVDRIERDGRAGSYVAKMTNVVKSWLAFNDVRVTRPIKIRGAHDTPTLHDERVPTPAELQSILLAGDEKSRVICALMSQSGLRPEVLGNYDGTDGLRLSDLPELSLDAGKVRFSVTPTLVRVRANLSKMGTQYFSFLSNEGCSYVQSYLEGRHRRGERLAAESPIITPKIQAKPFIRTTNIGDAARKAIRAAGFSWRPYVLRSYFATQMMLGESRGFLIRDYRVFFMGHKGDIEAVYTLNKPTLPDQVVEQMRSAYAKAQALLQTTQPTGRRDDVAVALRKELLMAAGYREDELSDDLLNQDREGFSKALRARLFQSDAMKEPTQIIVALRDLEERLALGDELIVLLPDGRAVLRTRRIVA